MAETLHKRDLVLAVAKASGQSQERCRMVLNTLWEIMALALAEPQGKVIIKELGVLETKLRKGRRFRHPLTRELHQAEDRRFVTFRAGKQLQRMMDGT